MGERVRSRASEGPAWTVSRGLLEGVLRTFGAMVRGSESLAEIRENTLYFLYRRISIPSTSRGE